MPRGGGVVFGMTIVPMPDLSWLPGAAAPAPAPQTPPAPQKPAVPASSSPRTSSALWEAFAAPVRARIDKALRHPELKLLHLHDAVTTAEDARAPDAMIALGAALDHDDHGWPLLLLARVDNLVGNALAPNDTARSLLLHRRALQRYDDGNGADNDVAYTLAQTVRRCVNGSDLDSARPLVARLSMMPLENGWVRNRFFEASLLVGRALFVARALDDAHTVVTAALCAPLSAPTTYTHEAHVDLLALLAEVERFRGHLDEGLRACGAALTAFSARPARERTAKLLSIASWAMLEGAFVARRLDRAVDVMPFIEALPQMHPQPHEAAYANALHAWALLRLNKLDDAAQALSRATTVASLPPWVASAVLVTQAQLAHAQGDDDQARALAQDVLDRFDDTTSSDDRAFARQLL